MKILIIAYPDLSKDPRPYRQIKSLSKEHEVYTVGAGSSGLENFFYKLKKHNFLYNFFRLILLKIGLHNWYYWDIYKLNIQKQLSNLSFDLIIAHEIQLVPLALKIGNNQTPVILDAHEYSPKNFDDSFIWRFFIKKYYTNLCKENISKLNNIITVSPGIVNAFHKNFNIKPILITNACEYKNHLNPIQPKIDKIKIIHHGIMSTSRSLHLLVDMMKYLDNNKYELNFMLTSTFYGKFFLKKLKRRARGLNINFLEPINRLNLIDFCNDYDIGVHFVPPTNFNLKYGLGNKFFEFIQSRLVVVIGPDIEMSKYVNKYKVGVISKDWTAHSLADSINLLDHEKIIFHKNQSHKYAKDLSCEENDKIFLKLINSFSNDSNN